MSKKEEFIKELSNLLLKYNVSVSSFDGDGNPSVEFKSLEEEYLYMCNDHSCNHLEFDGNDILKEISK